MLLCKKQPHDVNILIDFFTEDLSRCPDNCRRGKMAPVRVRVWFRISVKIRVGGGGQFSLRAIVLELLPLATFAL